jgi:hypothetical protein
VTLAEGFGRVSWDQSWCEPARRVIILAAVAVLGVVFLIGLRMLLQAPWHTVEVDAGGDIRTGGWFKVKLRKPPPGSAPVPIEPGGNVRRLRRSA